MRHRVKQDVREDLVTEQTRQRQENVTTGPDDAGLIARAEQIARRAHTGQTDLTGAPYVDHCQRVAASVSGEDARLVALLHDALEKGEGWMAADLRREGMPEHVIAAVEKLTRLPGETGHAFLTRICGDELASRVKIADLEDNIAQCQSAGLGPTGYESELEEFLRLTGRPATLHKAPHRSGRKPGVLHALLAELGVLDLLGRWRSR